MGSRKERNNARKEKQRKMIRVGGLAAVTLTVLVVLAVLLLRPREDASAVSEITPPSTTVSTLASVMTPNTSIPATSAPTMNALAQVLAQGTAEPTAAPTATPEPIRITVSGVGDCTLGGIYNQVTEKNFTNAANTLGMDYFFANVHDILSADDLTIANLEVVLTNRKTYRANRDFIMHGDPAFTAILTAGSVEAVTVANNHAKDFGTSGLDDMKQSLAEAGIDYCGFGDYAIYEVKGVKIGLLGYTVWHHKTSLIKTDVSAMKEVVDLVIVSIHGGEELQYWPTSKQVSYAHAAIDAGADLVLEHHPHVVSGMELYQDKYIVYSLGNFCFGGNKNPDDHDTIIFQETFTLDPGTKALLDTSIKVIPCSITSDESLNNCQPTPLREEAADAVLKKIEHYSSKLDKPIEFGEN